MSTTLVTTKDAKKFVFFSPLTKGNCGRPIKIKASLLPQFISLVDPKSHDGQTIIRHIQGLRATAGQGGSYQNMNNAFEHMERVKHVQICYKILQVDANSPVGVYITDLRSAYAGDGKKAGLYSVGKVGSNLTIKDTLGLAISGANIVINGSCSSNEHASENALKLTSTSSTVLFYNPSHVVNELGFWSNPTKHANNAQLAASTLAEVLMKNQNRTSSLNWHIEGEGAALLVQALSKVTGELSNQKFRFIDPVGDTTTTINLLKGKKAQLASDVVSYSGKRAAAISLLGQRNKLANTIKSLVSPGHPVHQEREKNVNKLMSDTSVNAAKFSGAMNMANGGQTTFTDMLKQLQGLV
ncbi:MAG: hypothetical protein V4732_03600 [Pseudomonadota bacterium]